MSDFQSPSPFLTLDQLNNWQKVFIADSVFFFISLIPFIFVVWRHWNDKNSQSRSLSLGFFFRFAILSIAKFVGGITGIVFVHNVKQGNIQKGLLIATLILFSISLGFFIIALQKLTEYKTGLGKDTLVNNKLRFLLTKFAHISIILNIVGAVLSYQGNSRDTAKTLLIVACAGFIVATFLEVEKLIRVNPGQNILLLLIVPFLIARITYSLVSSANININPEVTYPFSKYSILLGKWEYYVFWGFIEEVIIVGLFLVELVRDVV